MRKTGIRGPGSGARRSKTGVRGPGPGPGRPPDQEDKGQRFSWWGRRLPAGEGKRKLVHAGMGLFALALPFLTWQQAALCAVAAFLFNWLVLPRLLGHRLTSARPGVSDRGVLLYPLVVLALIVLYRPTGSGGVRLGCPCIRRCGGRYRRAEVGSTSAALEPREDVGRG